MNNRNIKCEKKTQDEVNCLAHKRVDMFFKETDSFVLPNDPLIKYLPSHPHVCPHKQCDTCGHDKYYVEYKYKQWDNPRARMANFAILRCDKCGASVSWVNKYLRNLLIQRNNLEIAEVD